ncbi:DASH complex subunit DAD2 [Erysiphe necator]|uniref:DASH complex subunit DAD2 n=1 Tax=Uncinula necator TaxID=52586 RepID=A0A0B1PA42_UNCNE|nr:DASH complex subunit DAD2 [Erysiphe necator]KHJ33539.1 putative dash complex subunit dad2 [Erysiphe necator]
MTNDPRYVHSQLRYGSTNINPETCPKSSILHARITEKKLELENLRQLRDLSAALAEQMQTLEEKLATLSDGTEVVATVLGNWHSVLQSINLATQKLPKPDENQMESNVPPSTEQSLPQTLVRIPIENASLIN